MNNIQNIEKQNIENNNEKKRRRKYYFTCFKTKD